MTKKWNIKVTGPGTEKETTHTGDEVDNALDVFFEAMYMDTPLPGTYIMTATYTDQFDAVKTQTTEWVILVSADKVNAYIKLGSFPIR